MESPPTCASIAQRAQHGFGGGAAARARGLRAQRAGHVLLELTNSVPDAALESFFGSYGCRKTQW